MGRILSWVLVASLHCYAARAATPVVEFDSTSGPLRIGSAVRVIPDPDSRFGGADVLAGRHNDAQLGIPRAPPNLGYPRLRYWAVLDFHNLDAQVVERLLVLWRGTAHRQHAYWQRLDAAGRGAHGVDEGGTQDIESRHAVMLLRLAPDERRRIAIRFDGPSSLSLDYRLLDIHELARIDRIDYWFFGLLTGVICAISIYVLALFFALRERLYLSFATFSLCNIVYQLHTEGYAYLLWPEAWRATGNLVSTYSGTLFSLLILQFVREYMRLGQTQPLVDRRVVRPVLWLVSSVFPLFLFWPWLANSVAAVGVMLGACVSAVIVFRGSWHQQPVWSFVIGILLFFGSGVVHLLKRTGVLPDAQALALVLQLGSAITTVAFAIAVMERVRRIVAENRFAQKQYANRLELEVRERTAELSEAKDRAEQALAQLSQAKDRAELALEQLQAAQHQLVQSEKMASLGQLVAGVAHEVNTPLGVALTATTFLEERAHTVTGRFEKGSLSKSELRGFLGDTEESTQMIERNLDRAAHLIASFKQVSVDRTSDGRRRFELAGYIDDLIASLEITWKRRPISLSVHCPQRLELDSFPGALGQVLTNLIQNALLHAFEPEQQGQMEIRVRELDASMIELRFCDNGLGVDAAQLGKIFEPFYTTKRNQGGTGLGLHVTWNLVVQKLGGNLSVSSTPGEGLVFVLRFPKIAPEHAAE